MINIKELFFEEKYLSLVIFASIFATLFTQFRIGVLPVGIGELVLFLLIGYYIISKKIDFNVFFQNKILKFWLLSFIFLSLGLSTALFLDINISYRHIVHDFLAYIFIFCIIFLLEKNKYLQSNIHKVFYLFAYFGLIFYSIVLVLSVSFENQLLLNERYPIIVRFIGLSSNPNQLAIFFTILPFIFFNTYKNGYLARDKMILLSILSIFIGSRILSDALILSYIVPLIFIFSILLFNKLDKIYKVGFIVVCLLIFILVAFNIYSILLVIDDTPNSINGRIELLRNALDYRMIFFGFGPGPHSYQSYSGIEKLWEAHNTYIDWFTQTGVIGLSLYLFLIFTIAKKLYQKGEIILLGAFLSILVFSTFHFIFRQPLFWLYIFYFYKVGEGQYKCAE